MSSLYGLNRVGYKRGTKVITKCYENLSFYKTFKSNHSSNCLL